MYSMDIVVEAQPPAPPKNDTANSTSSNSTSDTAGNSTSNSSTSNSSTSSAGGIGSTTSATNSNGQSGAQSTTNQNQQQNTAAGGAGSFDPNFKPTPPPKLKSSGKATASGGLVMSFSSKLNLPTWLTSNGPFGRRELS